VNKEGNDFAAAGCREKNNYSRGQTLIYYSRSLRLHPRTTLSASLTRGEPHASIIIHLLHSPPRQPLSLSLSSLHTAAQLLPRRKNAAAPDEGSQRWSKVRACDDTPSRIPTRWPCRVGEGPQRRQPPWHARGGGGPSVTTRAAAARREVPRGGGPSTTTRAAAARTKSHAAAAPQRPPERQHPGEVPHSGGPSATTRAAASRRGPTRRRPLRPCTTAATGDRTCKPKEVAPAYIDGWPCCRPQLCFRLAGCSCSFFSHRSSLPDLVNNRI
jgi:hypothetical protein